MAAFCFGVYTVNYSMLRALLNGKRKEISARENTAQSFLFCIGKVLSQVGILYRVF
jgi:hypothetical protein